MEKREISERDLNLTEEKFSALHISKVLFMAAAMLIWPWVKYSVKRCSPAAWALAWPQPGLPGQREPLL